MIFIFIFWFFEALWVFLIDLADFLTLNSKFSYHLVWFEALYSISKPLPVCPQVKNTCPHVVRSHGTSTSREYIWIYWGMCIHVGDTCRHMSVMSQTHVDALETHAACQRCMWACIGDTCRYIYQGYTYTCCWCDEMMTLIYHNILFMKFHFPKHFSMFWNTL